MKTFEQQPPQESIVERQKREAAIEIESLIKTLTMDGKMSTLQAAHKVYDGVLEQGGQYRKEQAIAKLLECLEMANEVDMRKEEIKGIYPMFEEMFNRDETDNKKRDYSLEKAA